MDIINNNTDSFGTDFTKNKEILNKITIVRSKGLKNEIAGYITKMLQRQAKFEERKQMIIENEKKSEEYKKSRPRKLEPAAEEVTQEPAADTSDEKTLAEEIIDESKSE